MEQFTDWFAANGGLFHKSIQLGERRNGEYFVHLRPEHTIEENEEIASCPNVLTFNYLTLKMKDYNGHRSKIDASSLSQDIYIRLALMEQYLLGKKSFWWPYIRILPQPFPLDVDPRPGSKNEAEPFQRESFHTPLFFDEEDMLWLNGTNVGTATGNRADDWRTEFELSKDAFKEKDERKQDRWTSDLYLWAATVFTSRSFSASALRIPGLVSPVLIPGVDLLNHSPSAKVTWNWGQSECSVQINQALSAESEVFNNYGPKSNEELLMGYGFCLDPNQADSFNLSYSPALSQHIKDAKSRRGVFVEGKSSSQHRPPSTTVTESTDCPPANVDSERKIGEDVKFVCVGGGEYHFCPGFLADCSLALQNTRERKENSICSPSITTFSNGTLSRNKLHTVSSILMILQQKQMDIRKHDGSLPPAPRNQNQTYASIYRTSQLKILEGVLQGLASTLQSICQIKIGEQPRVVRLADIMQDCPKSLKRHFREVVYAGVHTREASKIVQRGAVKFAFAMWLCGLRLLHLSGNLAHEEPALSQWIDFLCRQYDHEAIKECACPMPGEDPTSSKADDSAETVQSYAKAIHIAAGKNPDIIYNNEWALSHSNLIWCSVIVREEGVRCPTVTGEGILGEEMDEFVLVIDTKEAT